VDCWADAAAAAAATAADEELEPLIRESPEVVKHEVYPVRMGELF
jgi:hypothetical protein